MPSKYLPQSLWDENRLRLVAELCDAHKDFLIENNWIKNYQPKSSGSIGGATPEDAQEHVTNRFLNSAARMQFVCTDPNKDQPDIRKMVLDQLAQGELFILDVAAGHGAGTLAILATICELRYKGIIPKLPLNVNIRGIDISPDALNYYAILLGKLEPWLNANGINTKISFSACDLNLSGKVNEVLDEFFEEASKRGSNRFLCTISALSGAKKEGVELMMDSLKLIAARLSHKKKSSSWLWVEPKLDKTWLSAFVETVSLTLKQMLKVFKPDPSGANSETPNTIARAFQWIDPLNGHLAKSHVVVMQFKNL